MKCEGCRVRAMARESIRHHLVQRAMVFRVEDGRLLPERTVQIGCDDVTLPVAKRLGQHVGDPGTNGVAGSWPLLRQRADFELHRPRQVVEGWRLSGRVVEQQHGRGAPAD